MAINRVFQLQRPIAFFDVETTGLNPEKDRIVQLSIHMFYPDPEREVVEWSSLLNPECPIPPGIHGITDEMVEDEPTFAMISEQLRASVFKDGIDLAGYNVEFDKGFIMWEFARCGIEWKHTGHTIDPFPLFKKLCGHKLTDAYKRFVDKKGFEGAHDANRDVKATWEVLIGMLDEHPTLPRTIDELAAYIVAKPEKQADWYDDDGKFVWSAKGELCITFGKFRGTPINKISRGYLSWMAGTNQSPEVTKLILDALEGKFPARGAQ